MALSTYWVSMSRRDLAEKAIVAKREKEATRIRQCREVASYHQELARKSSKYRTLEEAQTVETPRMHEESRVKEDRIAAKKEKLELRRKKLARLLDFENDIYMKELEELANKDRDQDPWNVRKLKEQVAELERKRKEFEQNAQKKYTHHLFTSGGYICQEKEDENLQKETTKAWQHRKEELEKLNLEKLQKEQERIKKLEQEQFEASREAKEAELLQLQEQEKWSDLIQKKVEELDTAEIRTKKLKLGKNILMGHVENLLSLQQRRKSIRDIHRRGFQKIQIMWQAKEKLRLMLIEVLHGLEYDNKLLRSLSDLNCSVSEATAFALLDLSCVAEGKEKIEMQIAMEKKREVEMAQLFHEEATKIWEDKKEKWILESIARDDIIDGIFKSLVNQVKQKIDLISEEQKKLIDIKEKCLRDIDEINQKTKCTTKDLAEKQDYFSDRASRLNEEIDSIHSARRPQSSTSTCRESFLGF